MTPEEISRHYEWETGNLIVETFKDKNPEQINAVLLNGHAPFVWGTSGAKAIEKTLRLKKKHLTIIIITDGGFTSACYGHGFGKIKKVIKEGQKWRVKQGWGKAVICTIGVENKGYTAGGKPTDKECQAFLRKVGKKYGGGYCLVRKVKKRKKKKKKAKKAKKKSGASCIK